MIPPARHASAGFFRHRPPHSPDTVVLARTTRYICAAVYLIPGFANRLITELVENEHRGVASSVGFDLGPVLRHCYRARGLLLARDAALTGILTLGLAITPFLPMWLAIGAGILVGAALWSRGPKVGAAAGVTVAVVLLCFVQGGVGLATSLFGSLSGLPDGGYDSPYTEVEPADEPLSMSQAVLRLGVVAVLAFGAYLWWQLRVYRIACSDLAAGRQHRLPEVQRGRVGRRVAAVAAAQWGNVSLTAHHNPFLGAGPVIHSWSMSLELRPANGAMTALDPVDLLGYVRRCLLAMRGDDLPERERIAGLVVVDYIVATGDRQLPDPLVDETLRTPYAEASPEAVDAIIRHPQGSLRYYLRTIVGAEGRDIEVDSRLVAPAQDQEVAVSTFLYVAVEGGMLFLEFVVTVLPPLAEKLHAIDRIAPERITSKAFGDAIRHIFLALPAAPIRLAKGLVAALGTMRRMDLADRESAELPVYDYGARFSAREAVDAGVLLTYLQRLDAEKYYKLVERAVTGSVLTFLEARGVDTAEYRSRAMTLLNQGVVITGGNVTGPVAAGPFATASTVQQPGAPTAAAQSAKGTAG